MADITQDWEKMSNWCMTSFGGSGLILGRAIVLYQFSGESLIDYLVSSADGSDALTRPGTSARAEIYGEAGC
jgi:hypothetical protein